MHEERVGRYRHRAISRRSPSECRASRVGMSREEVMTSLIDAVNALIAQNIVLDSVA